MGQDLGRQSVVYSWDEESSLLFDELVYRGLLVCTVCTAVDPSRNSDPLRTGLLQPQATRVVTLAAQQHLAVCTPVPVLC